MLGDNTRCVAAMLRPINFQCFRDWVSAGLPCLYTVYMCITLHTPVYILCICVSHIHTGSPLAQNLTLSELSGTYLLSMSEVSLLARAATTDKRSSLLHECFR